ncbi:MAG: tRNA pseudouridine(38-40) synthase TruA [Bacteroidota bacterium]|nr:tRNA pseudouridine(38-40) synthase TruA [Bacteroidota bacterium]
MEENYLDNMQKYAILLQYNGTNYHGWQIQPNANSIQETLQVCFSNLLKQDIQIIGCGRTDTGVHARKYVAHFCADIMTEEQINQLIRKINIYLPADIRIFDIKQVPMDFNARFDAISRTYKYYISKNKQPFNQDFSWFYPVKLDIQQMNIAAYKLCEYKDFTSFSKVKTQVNNFACTVYLAEWEESKEYLIFTIKANRFLRNMVRCLVGTLIEVGKGKISIRDFANIIEAKDRRRAGFSAEAKGLFLEQVEYDNIRF